jgi:spore germination cell wall hydrolase CwlJ-like protein
MTDVTLDREQVQTGVVVPITKIISIILMILGLLLSVSLLSWTVKNRLAASRVESATPITAEVRERQLGCLAKNIYHEAGSEPFEGKVAVAQVTLNRAASGQFPGDVCRVVYQKNLMYEKVICQFSWACDRDTGMRPKNKANYDESMAVAKKVLLEGFKLPSLENAMYFHGDYINPGWNRKKVAHIGRHIFYE